MIKCTECGYENMDGLDYCDGCGAKLAAAPAPATDGGAPAAAPAEAPKTEAPEAAAPQPAVAAESPAAEAGAAEAPTGELKPEPAPSAPAPSAAPAEAAAFKAKFIVVRGGRKGQEFPLEDGNNLIGRWDPETGSFP